MTTADDPKRDPGNTPPRKAPARDDQGTPRRAPADPKDPASIEAPPSREPGPPPANDDRGDPAVGVEHEGATEDQVGDRVGPGVGYDEEITR